MNFYQLEMNICGNWQIVARGLYACSGKDFRAMLEALVLSPGQRVRRTEVSGGYFQYKAFANGKFEKRGIKA